ncbi:MAG: TetR/AcrR family transcriptional regulator [Xanthomonadaceae bacterium]|jgi:AcrR family transcriptional regulator|nr:TetR/AcrR family transcriptional regulator [Xanthomonadaceae bacterium]
MSKNKTEEDPPLSCVNFTATAPRQRPKVGLRRRGEIRAQKFLDAAIDIFLEKGCQNARLTDIVAKAGGSLSTLYRVYGDKEGLVQAIMEKGINCFSKRLNVLHESPLPPQLALMDIVDSLIDAMLEPEHIIALRVSFSEGLAFPELRDWFREHGITPAHESLEKYFQREKEAGRLRLQSPRLASHYYYMIVLGDIALSFNNPLPSTDAVQIKQDAYKGVQMFLHGVLP